MSAQARFRMRSTERVVLRYYNDMGKKKGNCTWGPGLLAHKGVCTEDELKRKVSATSIDMEFDRRVAEAERMVVRRTKIPLNQAQFDALVSLTYNAGVVATRDTFDFINRGDFDGAADNIEKITNVSVGSGKSMKTLRAPGLAIRRAEEAAPFRQAKTENH